MRSKRNVLFYRTWQAYDGGTNGGQLKMKDAFEHFLAAPDFEPLVYFPPTTVWHDHPGNHWRSYRQQATKKWQIKPQDLLFFSGHDWEVLSPADRKKPPVPIINITQPRHTRPNDPRQVYLQYPAIRIAKSSMGKQILEDYGVNGPVYLIPDAIDMDQLPALNTETDIDVLILGLKHPGMAKSIQFRLEATRLFRRKTWKIAAHLPPGLPTRADFLNLLNRAKIIVCLPLDNQRGAEGFYLPALEAMALEKLVICPYAIGNIDFCIANETCLQPQLNTTALYRAALSALNMPEAERQRIIQAGKAMAQRHDIRTERKTLLALLREVDQIWGNDGLFLIHSDNR
ncbi:MAG: hypothetical protein AAGJ93_13850 [Bacteroidota bacterium]